MTLFLVVLVAALVFEYINGFHDAANAIATVVSTKVLTPRQAIMMAAFFNLFGALMGTAVATTIGRGLVDAHAITMVTVFGGLFAAIVWGLFTWWLGLPSSSSHALVGGLCGAALSTAKGDWSVLKWSLYNPEHHAQEGLWPKIVMPMFASPVIGFVAAALFMLFLYAILKKTSPRFVNRVFGKLQLVSAAWMGFSHGSNDAQKTMGIIALALFTGTQAGAFNNLPDWLSFLHTPEFTVHKWIMITCALTMAAGTAGGGWRIIKTMGHKMVKLQPVHGFAAETTAALIIHSASHVGVPLSTTHVISTSIMGVGATKRLSAVKWGIVSRILWAWVLTLPVTGLIGWLTSELMHKCGL
ncbi:inorganic phosphate transporter [Opitutaceae bacterium TAV4]|uniref:inorganic phosphate transporter n=1 Tax=Geminisphaera colitermitum TaxID=1148786 RepID=UPI00019651A8|nr:inorganic phosphate transporter [Geminisphaera colitermitum]RRJ97750.1 inorganic phosphate transporter [Opitutaceae bacterium TAV4]RRK02287.1 inorganic phosphate transporter [Opitutaceae bacterium TAV3]